MTTDFRYSLYLVLFQLKMVKKTADVQKNLSRTFKFRLSSSCFILDAIAIQSMHYF